MKTSFSSGWKASTQPRKQRKYRANAPMHIKRKFLSAHLSKELRKKYGSRSILLRKDDKVKIMRGSRKGESAKIEKVSIKKGKVALEGMQISKPDGSKADILFEPSNLMVIEMNSDDPKRMKKFENASKKNTST